MDPPITAQELLLFALAMFCIITPIAMVASILFERALDAAFDRWSLDE